MKITDKDKALLQDCSLIILAPILSTYTVRGVRPLIMALEKGELTGATVIDRAIGKASALIMAEGGVVQAYTRIISVAGLKVLEDNGIEIEYDLVVNHIFNRNKDNICPMEKLTENLNNPKEAVTIIKKRLSEM